MLWISRPGFQYDELLFGNAALGIVNPQSFNHRTLWGIPILLMPYIGALKAYLYYPILHVFPVNAYSLRMPVVLLGCLTLILTYGYTGRLFGRRMALITTLLLACDPTFIFANKLDWAPISLMMLLKSAALLFLAQGIQTGRRRSFAWAGLFMALGVFNKLDFVWFVNAVGVSLLIIYRTQVASFLRKHARVGAAISAVLLFSGGLFLKYVVGISREAFGVGLLTSDLSTRALQVCGELVRTLDGNSLYYVTTRSALAVASPQCWLGVGAIAVAIVARRIRREPSWNRVIAFFASLFVVILLQIYATSKATGVRHMLMIYPLPQVMLGYFLDRGLGNLKGGHRHHPVGAVMAMCLVAIVSANLLVVAQYLEAYREDRTAPNWSSDIYALVHYAQRHRRKTFVPIDWGFQTQLLTLSHGTVPLKEMAWTFKDLEPSDSLEGRRLRDELLCRPDYLFLAHSDGASNFLEAKDKFFALASSYELQVRLLDTPGERKLYEVYAVRC